MHNKQINSIEKHNQNDRGNPDNTKQMMIKDTPIQLNKQTIAHNQNQKQKIRNRILSVSNDQQDSQTIMQNAQIRTLMEEYDIKFNPKIIKQKGCVNTPFLTRSQSQIGNSINHTSNSQILQSQNESKIEQQIQKRVHTQSNDADDYSNKKINLSQTLDNKQETKINIKSILPTISQKLIARMTEQANKYNKGLQEQAKEQIYQAQKAYTQSTMHTENSLSKFKLQELNNRQLNQNNKTSTNIIPQRSLSEKKQQEEQYCQDIFDDKNIFVSDINSSQQKQTQQNEKSIIVSSSQTDLKKIKQIQKPQNKKSLIFIENLSEYARSQWTQLLQSRVQNSEFQKASKELTRRGQYLIKLFESFITEEINQCTNDDISLVNSLIINEVSKILEDTVFYSNTLLKKIKDNRKEKEEGDVIELFGYCMKFNNPEHSEEFIQELKSFFFRKYQDLKNKLRVDGNSSTQVFLDTLQNVEIFFKLYKDKLIITQQKVESLKQELLDSQTLIAELEEKAKNRHYQQERTQIEYFIKNRDNVLEVQKRYQTLYHEKIEENKQSTKRHEKEIESLKEALQQKDLLLQNKEQEIQQFKLKLSKRMVDVSTQIQMHIMPFVPNSQQQILNLKNNQINQFVQVNQQLNITQQQISNPFSQYSNNFISPFALSKSCSGAIVSLILTECVLFDYSLFHRHRFSCYSPSMNNNHLVSFTHHFFVTKFGNKLIGEIFLKNFVQSLQEFSLDDLSRFTIFCKLTGQEIFYPQQLQQKQLKQNSSSPDNNKNRGQQQNQNQQQLLTFSQYVQKIFWESKQCYIIYVRISLLFRKILLKNLNNQQLSISGALSLFDNTELQNKAGQTEGYENVTITLQKAQSIIQDIISEHLPQSELIFEAYKSFQNFIIEIQQKNGSSRKNNLNDEKDEKQDIVQQAIQTSPSRSSINKHMLNKRVTMDQIAMFILDYLSELKSLQIDRFLSSVKLIQNDQRNTNLSIKEFTESFKQHFAFSPFISQSSTFIDNLFSKFLMNAVTALYGGDEQKKSALKPFLMTLFDEFNEYENENLSFYLTSEHLRTQTSKNLEKILTPHKKSSKSMLFRPSSIRNTSSQDEKRSHSLQKKQTQEFSNFNGVKFSLSNSNSSITIENQIIQILQEELYDIPNNIIFINESYEQVKQLIRSEESLDDRIKLDHEKFKSLQPQLNKIKSDLTVQLEGNSNIQASTRKSYIEKVKYIQQSLNNVLLYATQKLNLPINF